MVFYERVMLLLLALSALCLTSAIRDIEDMGKIQSIAVTEAIIDKQPQLKVSS